MIFSAKFIKWGIKPVLFLACLSPVFTLGWGAYTESLSANPIDDITDATGTWTLRLLLITLSITPIRKITHWHGIIQVRRMLGLFAFFYACLHFVTYVWLDQSLVLSDIVKDIPKRPFITAGFIAFVLLAPPALTSTKRMIRRLGGRRWNTIHKLVYVAATCGIIHYLWLVKADKQRPYIYGAMLSLLLGYRIIIFFKSKLISGNADYNSSGKERSGRSQPPQPQM